MEYVLGETRIDVCREEKIDRAVERSDFWSNAHHVTKLDTIYIFKCLDHVY